VGRGPLTRVDQAPKGWCPPSRAEIYECTNKFFHFFTKWVHQEISLHSLCAPRIFFHFLSALSIFVLYVGAGGALRLLPHDPPRQFETLGITFAILCDTFRLTSLCPRKLKVK